MSHTATLLSDGRVLIAAGGDTSADLYDPKTGKFSRTGSMSGPRTRATATLLSDGRVLIAGGYGASGVLASAELYDPATGVFTATGSMKDGRSEATATLLSDGRVLIAGGYDGLNAAAAEERGTQRERPLMAIYPSGPPPPHENRASAELYDPGTGKFTATGSMKDGRMNHTAALLPDGRVLIAGGFSDIVNFIPLASAELYDPSTGKFTATGSMTVAGTIQTATLLSNGRVLVAGGAGVVVVDQLTFFTPAELFDPKTGKFTATGSMTDPRTYATATLLSDGRVLIVGGNRQSNLITSAELYDPATGMFTAAGTMATARFSHTATRLQDGRVLIAGGLDRVSNPIISAELYQP
jgi:hypothetical protein